MVTAGPHSWHRGRGVIQHFGMDKITQRPRHLGIERPAGGQNQPPPAPTAPPANGVAPDDLGSYARRGVAWIEGTYVTLRPSFGGADAIYAYRTEIAWDDASSCLQFRESERLDAAFTQFGSVSVPNQSGHIYLVTTATASTGSSSWPARPLPARCTAS